MHSQRAFTMIEVAVVAAALAVAGSLAGWKPLQFLKRKPPTEQVTKLQGDLAKAQAELEATRAAAAQAAADERARQEDQVRHAQQMTAGAAEALRRVPAENRTPEVSVAADMTGRAELALGLAIGGLPPAKQAEITRIVDQLLSGKQADLDAARTALANLDAEIRGITAERDRLKTEARELAGRTEKLAATVNTVQAELTAKTRAVVAYAAKADENERRAGSLGASVNRLLRVLAGLAALWLFLGWGAAPMLKLMRPGRCKNFLRDVIGYLTSGFLHHDAKTKIASQKTT